MTTLLAILGAAALFLLFGLAQRGRDADHRCATCPGRDGSGSCPLTACPDDITAEPTPPSTGPRRTRRSS